jgi:hypothetical protein
VKRDYFVFEVLTEVSFTKEDVDFLIDCSEHHYDGTCRRVSQEGGFVYGMRNVLRVPPGEDMKPGTWKLSMSNLDLLCKVTERLGYPDANSSPLHLTLRELLREARDKYREVNKHLEDL